MSIDQLSIGVVEQKVFEADTNPNAWFGSAVAIWGNLALIGAKNTAVNGRRSQGAVYFYKKMGGSWERIQELTASDGAAGDQFGVSVAIYDRLAIISAPFAQINGKTWQGAVYFFYYSGNQWVQIRKIVARAGKAFDTFGTIVRMSSSWLFVAAGGANQAGRTIPYRVFIFKYSPRTTSAGEIGGVWTEKMVLNTPDSNDENSSFGASIAISDSEVVIGARTATIEGDLGRGAAYVYVNKKKSDQWQLTDRLVAEDGAARDNFGVSVAFGDNEILVGAQGAAINGNISQGAVYRFRRESTNWQQTQKLIAEDGRAINLFGASMSLAKNRLVVGAYAANGYRGTAYMFVFKNERWQQTRMLRASDGVSGDVFGYYTALWDADALVGAYSASINGTSQQGAAYFYALPRANPFPDDIALS